jgi:hypothetical protein
MKNKILITILIITISITSVLFYLKLNFKTPYKINMQNFLQIKMGMSYDEVKSILGDGKIDSSVNNSGVTTKLYSWKSNLGGLISITLQGNKVTNKAETKLIKQNSKVTLKDFNMITVGMTYTKIKSLFGQGQLIYEAQYIYNDKCDEYSWINNNKSSMTIVFINNKVVNKAETNLF